MSGFIVSMIVAGVMLIVILSIAIPMDRKYIVRENRRINYRKTTIFLRWNYFDTLTVVLAVYTVICVQILNFLISGGYTVENNYVQFFTNQSQAWTLVTMIYFVMRLTNTYKSIRAHYGEAHAE
ncbi:group-specific protein [Alteribacter natronophilus]|uniref:group-specific protein n=1 Tax=Alteribacter natronophilus TaxID=2583810 RepID=UPI00110D917C|nr:group-specific protein [Alteribacter natronophilus]TMW71058.1 group-specific protein [Alteribacter natronophilus]